MSISTKKLMWLLLVPWLALNGCPSSDCISKKPKWQQSRELEIPSSDCISRKAKWQQSKGSETFLNPLIVQEPNPEHVETVEKDKQVSSVDTSLSVPVDIQAQIQTLTDTNLYSYSNKTEPANGIKNSRRDDMRGSNKNKKVESHNKSVNEVQKSFIFKRLWDKCFNRGKGNSS